MTHQFTKDYIKIDSNSLFTFGWDSNVFAFSYIQFITTPNAFLEFYIDILRKDFISKPCWNALLNSEAEYRQIIRHNDYRYSPDFPVGDYNSHRFVFKDIRECATLALKVQKSATNKRKNATRRERLDASEGFYDETIIKELYEIQEGKCYYSGEKLNKENQTIDHLEPLCKGGSQWPINLALCTVEMNRLKGGHLDPIDLIKKLSKAKGKEWTTNQVNFVVSVDKKRSKLNREYKIKNNVELDEEDYL